MLSDPEEIKMDAIASAASLTAQEINICEMVSWEMSYRQVAYALGISTKTIHVHVTNIRRKMTFAGLLAPNSRLSLAEVLAGLAKLSTETVVVDGGSKEKT